MQRDESINWAKGNERREKKAKMTEWRQEDYQNTHNHNKTDDRSCCFSDLRFTLREKGKEKEDNLRR